MSIGTFSPGVLRSKVMLFPCAVLTIVLYQVTTFWDDNDALPLSPR